MTRVLLLIWAVAATACGTNPPATSTQSVRYRLPAWRTRPDSAGKLATFIGLRGLYGTVPVVITICGSPLVDLVTDSLRRRIASNSSWNDANELRLMRDCSAYDEHPSPPFRNQIRIDSLVLTADSAYVRARSLRAWDGRGDPSIYLWLREILVIKYLSYPYHYFLISGFERFD